MQYKCTSLWMAYADSWKNCKHCHVSYMIVVLKTHKFYTYDFLYLDFCHFTTDTVLRWRAVTCRCLVSDFSLFSNSAANMFCKLSVLIVTCWYTYNECILTKLCCFKLMNATTCTWLLCDVEAHIYGVNLSNVWTVGR